MNKIYHIVPPRVEGLHLMPLNDLKTALPEVYRQHAAKYVGREELMSQIIPHIDCSWNDVLQFSPVHPEQIRDALLKVGFGWRPLLTFEIDPEKAGMNSNNTVIFKHRVRAKGDFSLNSEEIVPFNADNLARFQQLPQATREHFQQAKESSEVPMLFLWVPHVLFKGQLPVEKLKIIEIA